MNDRDTNLNIAQAQTTIGDRGSAELAFVKGQVLFAQGDPADSVFHIKTGKVKMTVLSEHGKEAVIALLDGGDFFGESCLAGQERRTASAQAITDGTAVRIERAVAARLIHDDAEFSDLFTNYILTRNIRVESDLVDHLFNSSEKRLARLLLILADFAKDGASGAVQPPISQEMLADMIGTTRSRVSHFMNKFRQLGLISYEGHSGRLVVHKGLIAVVLNANWDK